ncbi:MAG TPA: hypothetical protein VM266_07940 [Solirubrobacteraceae bacterium]|nr:hypothetical protein [Solirubrobacteraceae bacterium]
MRTRIAAACAAACTLAAAAAGPASAQAPITSPNVSHVKQLKYEARNGTTPNYGTDIEFTKLGGREYALAGSYRNGLQIVDITNPEQASIVAVYDCGVTQGDVQVFRQADEPGRTFIAYTSDTYGDGTSTCYREAKALGFDVHKANGSGRNGTFIAEITDPLNPRTISFVEFAKGSHNITVHPSGNWLYNSNSDLITSVVNSPGIEYTDISEISRPGATRRLDLPVRPGLGTESHDLTFNERGTRAYSAALSQGVIIDTTDPGAPKIVTSFLNPAINVWHQADPFTLKDATGREREYLMVEDEYAGAAAGGECPNGGVWFYEVTGELEKNPALVGYFNISEVRPTDQPVLGRCTAHVFDVHEDQQIATIAWYNAGSRVLDLSGLTGVSLGGTPIVGDGVKEIGSARFTGSDTWSAKTPKIHPVKGDFFLYSNDTARGLDIWRFRGDGKKPGKGAQGRWMSGSEAQAQFAAERSEPAAGYRPFCLLAQ